MQGNRTIICNECLVGKHENDFNNCISSNSGKQYKCRLCEKKYKQNNRHTIRIINKKYYDRNPAKTRINKQKYYLLNKEKLKLKHRLWHAKNKHKVKLQKQKYFSDPNKREMRKSYETKWRKTEKYKSYQREYARKRRSTDLNYALAHRMRNRIRTALLRRCRNARKVSSTTDYLGCDWDFLKNYIESKFTEGMSWERFFNQEIHIDHVKACSRFDLSLKSERSQCFHYTNLQPLWAKDNLSKSNKIIE